MECAESGVVLAAGFFESLVELSGVNVKLCSFLRFLSAAKEGAAPILIHGAGITASQTCRERATFVCRCRSRLALAVCVKAAIALFAFGV